MNVSTGLKYWIFYEEDDKYYCNVCIDDRLEEAKENNEFSEHFDYEIGESVGYMCDPAFEDEDCVCAKCGTLIITE